MLCVISAKFYGKFCPEVDDFSSGRFGRTAVVGGTRNDKNDVMGTPMNVETI